METVSHFITGIGFPTFVALYVLMRLEPTVRSLEKSVNVLTYVLAQQTGVDYKTAKKICDKVNGGEDLF